MTTSLADLYRAHRAAQSGSQIYRTPSAQKAATHYETAAPYAGLAQYAQREAPEPVDTRSAEAIRRATEVSAWGVAAQRQAEEVDDAAWAQHRAAVDSSTGSGTGLISQSDRAAWIEQSRANRFGPRIQPTGHLIGAGHALSSSVPARVYASQLNQSGPARP